MPQYWKLPVFKNKHNHGIMKITVDLELGNVAYTLTFITY